MSGIYLHIPFCDTKCIYCDFYSITNHSKKNEFIDALIKEIKSRAEELRDYKFDTVFFGGGTPSLLPIDDFSRIFEALHSNYDIQKNSEITIEANPGTLDKKKLNELKTLPINRLSFGVQSFIDDELKFLTRIHSSEQAMQCVENAQDAGFGNINVDLIFALPGQSFDNWIYNLETAVNLNTQHISAYSLIFEDGTYLKSLLDSNKVKQADEETEAEMYEHTISYLTDKQFNQYEVSNFAKDGFECRHNLKYWNHEEYIGFGPSAASFVNNYRYVNVRDINKYIDRINKIVDNELGIASSLRSSQITYDFVERIDSKTSMDEFIFLGLRSKGLDIEEFQNRYKQDFLKTHNNSVKGLIDGGLALLKDNRFKLTPKGYALCDEIVANHF